MTDRRWVVQVGSAVGAAELACRQAEAAIVGLGGALEVALELRRAADETAQALLDAGSTEGHQELQALLRTIDDHRARQLAITDELGRSVPALERTFVTLRALRSLPNQIGDVARLLLQLALGLRMEAAVVAPHLAPSAHALADALDAGAHQLQARARQQRTLLTGLIARLWALLDEARHARVRRANAATLVGPLLERMTQRHAASGEAVREVAGTVARALGDLLIALQTSDRLHQRVAHMRELADALAAEADRDVPDLAMQREIGRTVGRQGVEAAAQARTAANAVLDTGRVLRHSVSEFQAHLTEELADPLAEELERGTVERSADHGDGGGLDALLALPAAIRRDAQQFLDLGESLRLAAENMRIVGSRRGATAALGALGAAARDAAVSLRRTASDGLRQLDALEALLPDTVSFLQRVEAARGRTGRDACATALVQWNAWQRGAQARRVSLLGNARALHRIPAEAEAARLALSQLVAALEHVGRVSDRGVTSLEGVPLDAEGRERLAALTALYTMAEERTAHVGVAAAPAGTIDFGDDIELF